MTATKTKLRKTFDMRVAWIYFVGKRIECASGTHSKTMKPWNGRRGWRKVLITELSLKGDKLVLSRIRDKR